ncbi:MAG: hypothetical protein ACI30C_01565 [Muribaculaceae bacterium]
MEAKFDYSAFISYEKEDMIWAINVQNFLERYSISELLTAQRISTDGKFCIEGYSNGTIKVFSIQDRNTLYSLILGEDAKINKIAEYGGE